jgi:glycosyltransferase involved in cell wall biosynthesis
MKISIITVCYNSAATIEDTLYSIANQNYNNIEHVVIDGGSTDGTLEILERHRSKIACLVSEPDAGLYDAMNKGLARVTGDIVAFLNADDFYSAPTVLATVAAHMVTAELDLLYGDVVFFRPDKPGHVVRRYSSKKFTPEMFAYGWMPAHPSLFVRRHLFEAVGDFKADYKIAGDYEFVARVFSKLQPRYKYLPEVLVTMRTGGVSAAGWRNTILLNQEVLRACRENGIKTNLLKILSKYPYKFLEFLKR